MLKTDKWHRSKETSLGLLHRAVTQHRWFASCVSTCFNLTRPVRMSVHFVLHPAMWTASVPRVQTSILQCWRQSHQGSQHQPGTRQAESPAFCFTTLHNFENVDICWYLCWYHLIYLLIYLLIFLGYSWDICTSPALSPSAWPHSDSHSSHSTPSLAGRRKRHLKRHLWHQAIGARPKRHVSSREFSGGQYLSRHVEWMEWMEWTRSRNTRNTSVESGHSWGSGSGSSSSKGFRCRSFESFHRHSCSQTTMSHFQDAYVSSRVYVA